MSKRKERQKARSPRQFMVPDKQVGEVFAVVDHHGYECDAEGVSVIALFDSKQIAGQFADARGYSVEPWKMPIYHAMKAC